MEIMRTDHQLFAPSSRHYFFLSSSCPSFHLHSCKAPRYPLKTSHSAFGVDFSTSKFLLNLSLDDLECISGN